MKGIFRIEIPVELEVGSKNIFTGDTHYEMQDHELLKSDIKLSDWIKQLQDLGYANIVLDEEEVLH